ncbi:hypothetical protein BaRGS_00040354 [Batillaria attramentaria]|uniref:Uncharacterized protein n=1 Tax=Batillaria attramentaria TaxID=370345 RepID=A0ABD0J0R5_9CAEN
MIKAFARAECLQPVSGFSACPTCLAHFKGRPDQKKGELNESSSCRVAPNLIRNAGVAGWGCPRGSPASFRERRLQQSNKGPVPHDQSRRLFESLARSDQRRDQRRWAAVFSPLPMERFAA